MVERITYESLPQIAGPYVHATKHNKTLYISGLTAYGTDVQVLSLTEQTKEILDQISTVLKVEGCAKNNLVKLTIFVRDISKLASIRELLFHFYDGHLPACSLVEVSKLIHPDLQIEIEAVVAL
ncbi:RidA family protein [Vibrio parahaemolyticus]|uniref:RidA family protein n=1 Tax=Vibrio parahaemolyticus TaxID=670 RepID=A0A7Y0S530_VIBPH|nr:RidA family protein [Vibrio parahaemolyticus]EIV8651541.1 RidA family protein [Vibrio parahaemolyticus]EJC6865036.1 RidA family protein [Vibrio parahaemolyticus]EJC7042489.1 RidA family protein [Vibrio parahaemolyticus]EJE4150152.1 RidA family protein [Vibrio parahaemolyticus]EJE4735837.1 RidA family protein [Vibrio parahaemolyticus]